MTRCIAQTYTPKTLAKRVANKRAVEQRFGLEEGDGLLHGVVSRLTWQKGMDIFAAEPRCSWWPRGARLALIGTGEAGIEQAIARRGDAPPGPHRRDASAMTKACRISCRRAATRSSCRRASSPAA